LHHHYHHHRYQHRGANVQESAKQSLGGTTTI
jgi:hypothetical protein